MFRNYVSVIIPVLDEVKNLKILIPHLGNFCSEIIIVVGDKDLNKYYFCKNYTDKIIKQNTLGKGNAIKEALLHVTKPITVLMDADLSHDPYDIPILTFKIFSNEADHVHGSRSLGGSDELFGNLDSFFRSTGSHVILLFINFFFKIHLTECQNGFRAIRTDILKNIKINETHTTFEQELNIKSLKSKIRVSEVRCHEYKRIYGYSKISLIKNSFRYIYSLFKYLFLNFKIKNLEKINNKWRIFINLEFKKFNKHLKAFKKKNYHLLYNSNPLLKNK